ncbi:hypothetical protein MIR68_005090 [Amoeboaphelidium protococcarum]|nr:hypothetical protein MIR68_005090 [Amoeboaphelidium protococcarum]
MSKYQKTRKMSSSVLEEEVKALGGDKKDLELVLGVQSDEESVISLHQNEDGVNDVKLQKDLKSFIGELGLGGMDSDDIMETDAEDSVEDDDQESDEESSVEDEILETVQQIQHQVKSAGKESLGVMIMPPSSQWYKTRVRIPQSSGKNEKYEVVLNKSKIVKVLYEYAQTVQAQEAKAYENLKFKQNKTEAVFFRQMVKKGTLSDKVGALSLAIKESPVHNLQYLQSLIAPFNQVLSKNDGQHSAGKRREMEASIDVLHELFKEVLCPQSRKLKFFVENQTLDDLLDYVSPRCKSVVNYTSIEKCLSGNKVMKQVLLLAYVEDVIKASYFTFITAIDRLSNVSSQQISSGGNYNKLLNMMYELLVNVPEQESTVLTMLVNKLSVNNRVLTSKIVHLLNTLISHDVHPQMKPIVIKEVERFLQSNKNLEVVPGKRSKDEVDERRHRSNFYALVFLSQVVLSSQETDIKSARHLMQIYMRLFQEISAFSNDGANAEEASGDNEKDNGLVQKKQKKRKFRKQKVDKNIAEIQCKIMSAILTGIRRAVPYAMLKLQSESESQFDLKSSQLSKHIDHLFAIIHQSDIGMMSSVQALQIILQILYPQVQVKGGLKVDDSSAVLMPQLVSRYFRALYASLWDGRHALSGKHHAIYLNVLYKSLIRDQDTLRSVAFIRRCLQICLAGPLSDDTAFTCGMLVIIGEVLKQKPELRTTLIELSSGSVKSVAADIGDSNDSLTQTVQIDEDEDAEIFLDRDENDNIVEVEVTQTQTANALVKVEQSFEKTVDALYDPEQRQPEHCNADKLDLFELIPFTVHHHPSVRLFATMVLNGQDVNYPSDPLRDFTLIRFLDRFVFKNPKQIGSKDGSKAMGVKAQSSSILRKAVPLNRVQESPVNSAEWINSKNDGSDKLAASNIPADEMFYHTYFKLSGKDQEILQRANQQGGGSEFGDDMSINDDEVDQAIFAATGSKRDAAEFEDVDSDDFDSSIEFDDHSDAMSDDSAAVIMDGNAQDEWSDFGDAEEFDEENDLSMDDDSLPEGLSDSSDSEDELSPRKKQQKKKSTPVQLRNAMKNFMKSSGAAKSTSKSVFAPAEDYLT